MKYFTALLLCAFFALPVQAQQPGSADEALKLYESMTPEQKAMIMSQAKARMADLKKMTPEQRRALEARLQNAAATIDFDKIDPAKLDPANTKSLTATDKDIKTYQRKYDAGKIDNPVIKKP